MSASHNRVTIIGNLGKDPELRYTQSEKPVCDFPVAVTEKYQDKETVTWFKVTCWSGMAENAAKYLSKGSSVFIEGRIITRSYDKDGETRYDWGVTAERLQFLGSPKGKSDSQGEASRKETKPKPSKAKASSDDFSDIPF